MSNILSTLDKYLANPKSRNGASVTSFIASGILIITFIIFPSNIYNNLQNFPAIKPIEIDAIRGICITYIIFLGIINYTTPYITATKKSFKCLKCEAEMETTELQCQNCKSIFSFKL